MQIHPRRDAGSIQTVSSIVPPPKNPPQPAEAPSPQPSAESWLTPFIPRRGLSNGHLQTIVGNFLPRPRLRSAYHLQKPVEVDPADGSRVLCHCHWQPEPVRAARLTVVLVHGLEGSSDSRYISGIAARAWAAGMNVVRMNMRNCGGYRCLTPTLYHSGRSADVGAVVRHFTAPLRPSARRARRLLHGRQSRAQTRRRMGRARAACGRRHRLPGHRSGSSAPTRFTSPPIASTNGTFFARSDAALPSQGRALPCRLSAPPDSARSAPSASSTRRSSRRYCGFSRCRRLLLPRRRAPASSIASPYPRSFSCAEDDPFIRLSPRNAGQHSRQSRTSPSSRSPTAATAPSSAGDR